MVVVKSRIKTGLYKHLHLLAPWKAEQLLGEPVEGPVFVSPFILTKQLCDICNIEYGPLVYRLGERTIAHHLHANFVGGIYTTSYAPNSYRWLTQGIGDDYFEQNGIIKCRSFLTQTQPKQPKGFSVLTETDNGLIIPTYSRVGDLPNQVGTVDDEGNMKFTMETWNEWARLSRQHN